MNNCRNCDAGHGDRRLRRRFPCGRGSSWRPRPGRVTLEVAEELDTTRATVGKWRRFLLDGCDGVLDEPRPGSPRKIGDDEAERGSQDLGFATAGCHPLEHALDGEGVRDEIHGDDPVQVYEELCEVIADVIDDFETRGQPPPDPRVSPVLQVK